MEVSGTRLPKFVCGWVLYQRAMVAYESAGWGRREGAVEPSIDRIGVRVVLIDPEVI